MDPLVDVHAPYAAPTRSYCAREPRLCSGQALMARRAPGRSGSNILRAVRMRDLWEKLQEWERHEGVPGQSLISRTREVKPPAHKKKKKKEKTTKPKGSSVCIKSGVSSVQ